MTIICQHGRAYRGVPTTEWCKYLNANLNIFEILLYNVNNYKCNGKLSNPYQ